MVGFQEVLQASETLKDHIVRTPVVRAVGLEPYFHGAEIYLKLENFQRTGSFKFRGATNKILNLSPQEMKNGVIAASSGNHGQAVAYAAHQLGVKATIVMPENAPQIKVNRARSFGAEVILCGFTGDDREEKAFQLVKETGGYFIHSHADPYVIAGQGTAALEILQDIPDLDELVTPLGAGGLICGTVIAAAGMSKTVHVTAVEPKGVPRMSESFKVGHPVCVEMGQTLADGLRVGRAEQINFDVLRAYPPEIVLHGDEHILEMMRILLLDQKIVAEPSSTIALAAALDGKIDTSKGRKVCCLISGGDVDASTLGELVK